MSKSRNRVWQLAIHIRRSWRGRKIHCEMQYSLRISQKLLLQIAGSRKSQIARFTVIIEVCGMVVRLHQGLCDLRSASILLMAEDHSSRLAKLDAFPTLSPGLVWPWATFMKIATRPPVEPNRQVKAVIPVIPYNLSAESYFAPASSRARKKFPPQIFSISAAE